MATLTDDPVGERDSDDFARNETELERSDRNLVELLQEVRVVQMGVQVLFGFLLAIAFQSQFRTISSFQRIDYFVTLLATGSAAILLIAPTAYHRILFRRGDKPYLVKVANRLTIIGLGAVGVAMIGAMVLITDFIFSAVMTVIVATVITGGCLGLWLLLPLARRRALTQSRQAPDRPPIPPADGAHGSGQPRSGSHAPTRL
jgi:hypothetical protein